MVLRQSYTEQAISEEPVSMLISNYLPHSVVHYHNLKASKNPMIFCGPGIALFRVRLFSGRERLRLLLCFAIAQSHEGIAGDDERITFHPVRVVVAPTAVVALTLGQGGRKIGAPIVFLAGSVFDFIQS